MLIPNIIGIELKSTMRGYDLQYHKNVPMYLDLNIYMWLLNYLLIYCHSKVDWGGVTGVRIGMLTAAITQVECYDPA